MQLSSLELSSLLEEVAAMVASRRPIVAGLSELTDKSMGQIGVAARQLSKKLDEGESPADAMASVAGGVAPMARAAMQCVMRTGSTDPVYHLAAVLRQRHERQMRATSARIYPALTLLVAYLVASVGLSTLIIELSENTLVEPNLPSWLVDLSHWFQQSYWNPVLVLACLCFCFVLAMRWSQGRVFWASRAPGETESLTNWASFCEMLAIATESGFPFDEAVEIAAKTSGERPWQQRLAPVVDAIRRGAVNWDEASPPLPPLLKWRVSRLASTQGDGPQAEEIRNLAQWYHLRSQQRWQFWTEWFPLLSTLLVISLLVLAICLLIVKPIYDLS